MFAATLLALLLCGTWAEAQVMGGTSAEPGRFPHLVSIQYDRQHICGGVIIDPLWVLTAAHCKTEMDAAGFRNLNAYTVLAGVTDLNSPGSSAQRVKVTSFIHKNYNHLENGNDIGIIKLKKPLDLDSAVQVAELPEKTPEEGERVTVAGWGRYLQGSPATSSTIQTVDLKVTSNQECIVAFGSSHAFASDNLCVAPINKGAVASTSRGDSGSPLYVGNQVVGIAAWAEKDMNDGEFGRNPSAFTNVYSHLSWIQGWIRECIDGEEDKDFLEIIFCDVVRCIIAVCSGASRNV